MLQEGGQGFLGKRETSFVPRYRKSAVEDIKENLSRRLRVRDVRVAMSACWPTPYEQPMMQGRVPPS